VEERWLAWVRISFAVLTLGAIVYQASNLIEAGVFNPTRFFLFFTILSNLTAAAVFLEGGRRQLIGARPVPDLWRGFAVVVMTITFIVFAVLLSDLQEELQTNVVWVDTVLHRLMPVAVMADWLIEPPHGPLTFRRALVPWLAPPLVWTTFTLIRGAIDGWYPYPFLNPVNGGYGSVALYAVAILALLLAVIWLVATAGPALRARRREA
jgi:hypothetical protein